MASVSPQALGFPAVWLRHNCPCPDCRDPVTGQRLVEITQISNGPGATVTAEFPDSVEVTFAPDGHRSVFSRAWLAASALDVYADADADPRTEDGKVLWRAAAGAGPAAGLSPSELSLSELAAVPAADWAAHRADDSVRLMLLDRAMGRGCCAAGRPPRAW